TVGFHDVTHLGAVCRVPVNVEPRSFNTWCNVHSEMVFISADVRKSVGRVSWFATSPVRVTPSLAREPRPSSRGFTISRIRCALETPKPIGYGARKDA